MEILNLPLSRSTVDRAAHIRSDEAALESAWQSATIIHFNGAEFFTREGDLARLHQLFLLRFMTISTI